MRKRFATRATSCDRFRTRTKRSAPQWNREGDLTVELQVERLVVERVNDFETVRVRI